MSGILRPTEGILVSNTSPGSRQKTLISDRLTNETDAKSLKRINVDLIEFGDVIKALHSGSPLCNDTVVQGDTKFDESSLTGVNGSSMLDQIVKAVREGQSRRAPIERIYFFPFVALITITTWIINSL
ncbi:hypothetical protein B0J14DRAFT_652825 [Halenospora varia]|nr:hypothetical protein B0J14DRAFT_652825 [Halenospora varia]